ncbi:MAG TPA: protein kinase [Polyangiaceae bacterium]|nr:protein kinase [Polyangiaceae bacterium]
MSAPRAELAVGGVVLVGPEPLAQSPRGEVWRGLSEGGEGGEGAPRLVACSLIRPWVVADEDERRSLLRRAAVRAGLACDAAPRHLGAWEFDAGDGVGVAMADELAGELRLFDVVRALAAAADPMGGRLSAEIALYVAWQVARLHRAARALGGGVELMVEPNDILLDWDGRVSVLVNPRSPAGVSASASDLAYLAPERLPDDDDKDGEDGKDGKDAQNGKDAKNAKNAKNGKDGKGGETWSIGVLLYELLAGHHPFRKADAQGTMSAILNESVIPLSLLRPDLPPSLSKLVERCLRHDPTARPPLGPLVDAFGGTLKRVRSKPTASLAGLLARELPARRAESLALRSWLTSQDVGQLLRELPTLSSRRLSPPPIAVEASPPHSLDYGGPTFAPSGAADQDAEKTLVEPDLDIDAVTVAIDLDAETVVLVPDLDGETVAVGPDLEADTLGDGSAG